MAAVKVQDRALINQGAVSQSSYIDTWTSNPAIGDKVTYKLIVDAYPGAAGQVNITATDNASTANTWAISSQAFNASSLQTIVHLYSDIAHLPASGQLAVTISYKRAGTAIACYSILVPTEWSGLVAGADQSAALSSNAVTGTSITVGPTGVLAQANELVEVAFTCDSGTTATGLSVPAGTTVLGGGIQQDDSNYVAFGAASQVVAATTAISLAYGATTNASGIWDTAAIATYKIATVNNSLAVSPGSYAVTTATVSLSVGHTLAAAPSSYAVTAAVETFLVARGLPAAASSYAVTMATENLSVGHTLNISLDTYAVAIDSNTYLSVGHTLAETPASYAVTIDSNTLLPHTALLAAAPDSYAVNIDPNSAFLIARGLPVAADSYAVNIDPNTGFLVARGLPVTPASYSVSIDPNSAFLVARNWSIGATSYAVNIDTNTLLTYTPGGSGVANQLPVSPASYTVTMAGVLLPHAALFSVAASSYAVSIDSATQLSISHTLATNPAVYAVSMDTNTGMSVGHTLNYAPATTSVVVSTQQLSVGHILAALPQSYAVTPAAVSFGQKLSMQVQPGSYSVTPAPASMAYKIGYKFAYSSRVLVLGKQGRNIIIPVQGRKVVLSRQRRKIPPT